MARYTDASCKLCRRERQKLFLKGAKCYSERCPIEKRNYPPGQHGQMRSRKTSDYGIQLREKQKVKRIYGLLETQFRNMFERALHTPGRTGENLVKLLERRLDNVVFRFGFAPSRKSARQLVLHGHVLVNKKKVDIPSYLIDPGDAVEIESASRQMELIQGSLRKAKETMLMSWLQLDKATMSGTFINVPERADVPLNANEQLIVELYSK